MKNKLLVVVEYLFVAALIVGSTWFLGTKVLTNANLLPAQGSVQAGPIDKLFGIHWWLISFFFSLIVVFILYSIGRSFVVHGFSPKGGFGEFFEGNARLEVIWTVVPLAIVLYLAFIGSDTLGQIERRSPGAVEISVIASQWSWRYEYTSPDGFTIVSEVLYLPVNQPVVLHLSSTDVIHSFWVPEFRIKQDALPGGEAFVRDIRITPTKIETYTLRCAELCGADHWSMTSTVEVVSQARFDSWLLEESAGCNDTDEACGFRWATVFGCFACHATEEGQTLPSTGPNWFGIFGTTETMTDGSEVLVDDEYLRNSILDPASQVVVGYAAGVMPANIADGMTEDQLAQVIAYIRSLSPNQ